MKRRFPSRRQVRLLLIGATLLALPSLLYSSGVSISVSPIRVEHLVKQGEKGTDMISVTNDGTDPTRLKVTIEDWKLTREGNPAFMKVGGNPYSCAEWIRINPVDFRIAPGQTREVRYTVTVPPEVQDGGYHAAIIFETVPDVTPGERAKRVYLKGRIVTIVYEVVGKPPVVGHATVLEVEPKKQGVDFVRLCQASCVKGKEGISRPFEFK